jgi:hypothetical protein
VLTFLFLFTIFDWIFYSGVYKLLSRYGFISLRVISKETIDGWDNLIQPRRALSIFTVIANVAQKTWTIQIHNVFTSPEMDPTYTKQLKLI